MLVGRGTGLALTLASLSEIFRGRLLDEENRQLQERVLQLTSQVCALERALRSIHSHSLEVRTCGFHFASGRIKPDSCPALPSGPLTQGQVKGAGQEGDVAWASSSKVASHLQTHESPEHLDQFDCLTVPIFKRDCGKRPQMLEVASVSEMTFS